MKNKRNKSYVELVEIHGDDYDPEEFDIDWINKQLVA